MHVSYLSDTNTYTQIHTCCDHATCSAVFIDWVLADSVKLNLYLSRNSSEHTDVQFDLLQFNPPPIRQSIIHAEELFIKHN